MKVFYFIRTLFLILMIGISVKSENFRHFRELQEESSDFTEDSRNSSKSFLSNTFGPYYDHVSSTISDKLSDGAQKIKEKFKSMVCSAGESIKNYITEKANSIQ
ncbi:uncharacterized protein cubi_00378 [Cryptosporidium ubiquitum]|uniref:Uncharacterized protein n=1 Tax=Cryptosporidium ubiquitum TaxID=857276 RepID=A0A1J4MKR6_9CRYT|nr:uncharacterized protein cubi_00378 [Cryptosporidium ubiquitum]OII74825.1 hypothetical protein cubi_00378 [Cryptosporidium ubiquitum]